MSLSNDNIAEAKSLAQAAYRLLNQQGDADKPQIIKCLFLLGDIAIHERNSKLAFKYFDQAHNICVSELTASNPLLSQSYFNLGVVYLDLGYWEKCLAALDQAIEYYANIYGKNCIEITESLMYKGYVYHSLDDFQKAYDFFEHAYNIRSRVMGANSPLAAKSLYFMANVKRIHGDLEDAIKLYKKVLNTFSSTLPDDHTLISNSVKELTQAMIQQQRYDDAVVLIMNQPKWEDNPALTNLLGDISILNNHLEVAETYYIESLKKSDPQKNKHILYEAIVDISHLSRIQGDYAFSIALALSACDLYESAGFTNPPWDGLLNHALALSLGGDHDEALFQICKTVDLACSYMGEDNFQTARARHIQGKILSNAGFLSEARDEFSFADEIYKKFFRRTHWLQALLSLDRGINLKRLDMPIQSRKKIKEAYLMFSSMYPDNHHYVKRSMAELGHKPNHIIAEE